MKPLLNWAGGKTRELPIINQYLPNTITQIVEPFVGGGSFFLNAQHPNNVVNDLNKELIRFYQSANDYDESLEFRAILEIAERERAKAKTLELDGNFIDYAFSLCTHAPYSKYIEREILKKTKQITKINAARSLENQELLSSSEIEKRYQSGCLAALYYTYRDLYNIKIKEEAFDVEHIAYWFIVKELAFSGMIRFSLTGKFNVPYGGLTYDTKRLTTKLPNYKSATRNQFYKNTNFQNKDFNEFFESNHFDENSFIFVDPPYDCIFNEYNDKSTFLKKNHIELKTILDKTNAKFMVAIQATPFIEELYKGYNIIEYDKTYQSNMRNRNNRSVKHILITNYKTA